MTAPVIEPVQMCSSASWEIQKLIGVKWNFCWRWHFQFMQPHPLEDNWNKSHLEAFMPYFLPVLTKVESLPILIWWVFSGVCILSCCSVTQSCPTLRPHELQLARLTCPSLSPRVCANSCSLSQWSHPTISSSVTIFSCPRSIPASGSFPISWLFSSHGQNLLELQQQSSEEYSVDFL